MAEHLSNEELCSMTVAQLHTRVQKLEAAQKKRTLQEQDKTKLDSDPTAAKAVIEMKAFRAMTLESTAGDKDALSRLYFKMDEQALMVRL